MTRNVFALACLVVALGACHRGPSEPFGRLTVAEVDARRTQSNVFIFDNNPQGRYRKSHLPGARWVNPKDMAAGDLPADKSATLIFYCASTH